MRRQVLALAALAIAAVAHPGGARAQSDERVQGYLDRAKVPYKAGEDGIFEVRLSLPEGRSQTLYIHSRTESFSTAPPGYALRRILAVAAESEGPFPASLMEGLLEENARAKVATWGVLKDARGRHLLICTAHVPADADSNTLLFTAGLVAKLADDKEARLAEADRH